MSFEYNTALDEFDLDSEELEAQMRDDDRLAFLVGSEAVPTPVGAFAIWVELFVRQGGKVRVSQRNYTKTATVDANKNAFFLKGDTTNTEIAYDNIGWNRWTPTKGGSQIPEGFGSGLLNLLVIPEVSGQEIIPVNDRKGWEWGHTTVMTIVRDASAPSGFSAWTNNPDTIWSFLDVEQMRKSMTLEGMMAQFGLSENAAVESPAKRSILSKLKALAV